MVRRIEISHKTIIFTVFLLLGLWFVAFIKDIILGLFVVFIIVSALRPEVERLERFLPRILAILLIYVLMVGIAAVLVGMVVPPLATEMIAFGRQLPFYVDHLLGLANLEEKALTGPLSRTGENILKLSLNVFSNMVLFLTLFVVSFYWLLERGRLSQYLKIFFGKEFGQRVYLVVEKVEERLGAWVRGELVLMMVIGVMTFAGLTILKVPYALALAVVAGILEIIPVIGPVVSAVPAILISLTISPFMALPVAALYLVVQLLENNLIVPVVMKKAVGVSPLLTIIALMTGSQLAGLAGALLSVPVVVVAEVLAREFWKGR